MSIRALLLDIEGTVCSISYVHEVLFPYARSAASSLIPKYASYFPVADAGAVGAEPEIIPYLAAFPEQARQSPESLLSYISDLMDRDVKDPALKSLQGYLWKSGYDSGEVRAPVYPDAIAAIVRYAKELPLGVNIYSSGSVPAQKLLFQHTEDPENRKETIDLTKVLGKYYDTTNAGPKTERSSYVAILRDLGVGEGEATSVLFLSDNPKEVDAAVEAGLTAYIVVRPGNAALGEKAAAKYKIIDTLEGLL